MKVTPYELDSSEHAPDEPLPRFLKAREEVSSGIKSLTEMKSCLVSLLTYASKNAFIACAVTQRLQLTRQLQRWRCMGQQIRNIHNVRVGDRHMTPQRDNTTMYPREKNPYLGKAVTQKQHQPMPSGPGKARSHTRGLSFNTGGGRVRCPEQGQPPGNQQSSWRPRMHKGHKRDQN